MNTLSFRNLSFAYTPGKPVFQDITFDVPHGAFVSLVGPSGCGKSTLVKCAAGILPGKDHSLTGEILFASSDAGGDPNGDAISRRVGYVFQDYLLLPFLTVSENIGWALDQVSETEKTFSKSVKVAALLDEVGLSSVRDEPPSRLSGGMRARVAIARALSADPNLLIVDEAFASLDVGWRYSLYEWLDNIRRTHRLSVICVSHDIYEACEISDQVVVMSASGSLAGVVTPEKMSVQDAVEKAKALIMENHPAKKPGSD